MTIRLFGKWYNRLSVSWIPKRAAYWGYRDQSIPFGIEAFGLYRISIYIWHEEPANEQ